MAEDRARVDLTIYKGQFWKKDAWFKEDGVIMDLTGVTAEAQIRPEENSEDLIADITCEIDSAEGHLAMSLSAAQTAAIPPGVYYWDLKMTDTEDLPDYPLFGRVHIIGRVTE